MSFAIEVPGEAVPLNPRDLCKALQAGTSIDHNQRQSATQQLNEWESRPDYFPALQTVFLDKSLPREIRYLAIILLKNGIDKFWRAIGGAKNVIPNPQKEIIRSRLWQGSVGEEDAGFALHNALVTAKIVRIDYPTTWPEAITNILDLLRNLKDGDQAHLSGALQILLRVIKELGTARLRSSQTAVRRAAPEITFVLADVYSQRTTQWIDFLSHGQGSEGDMEYAMRNSLMCLRILRRMLIAGYDFPHEHKFPQEFWGLSQMHFGQFLAYLEDSSAIPAPYQDWVGKHLLQFTKLHIEMSESHPASFVLLPNTIPLVRSYWGLVADFAEDFAKSGGIRQSFSSVTGAKSKVEGRLRERLALQGLLVFKSCIAIAFFPQRSFKYRSKSAKVMEEQAINAIKTELFTAEFVPQVLNVIMTKLFMFRNSDLEAWEEAPEEWEAQEHSLGDGWQWRVRPCAERVFMDLIIHYKDLLGPPLLSYFQTALTENQDIITKEAIYTAMGCAVDSMYNTFDFDAFLASTLVHDAQQQGRLAKLLRRRIAILLSRWVPVKLSDDSRPLVYEMFRHLLNRNDATNDEVVRITAARQLKSIADDFEFKGEGFQPYAADIFSLLVGLVQEVELDDNKLAVLETLRSFINRMDRLIVPFSNQIMSVLPRIWESAAADQFMTKQAILSIISTLLVSIGVESKRYHSDILPLIAESMNPSSQLHQFVLEEAVDVWKSLVTQCDPPLSEDLIKLELISLDLLDHDSRLAEQALEIVKSYIVLAPEAILGDQFRRPTLTGLVKAMDAKSAMKTSAAAKPIQHILRYAQELGGSSGVAVIVQDMAEIGFLRHVLERVHDTWEAQKLTGPKAKLATNKLKPRVEIEYLSILARVALADPELFVKLLSSTGDLAAVWDWLSQEWFSCLDNMADVDLQKLSCLALTRLCELPQPMQDLVLGKLQHYFSMWTTIVSDLQEEGGVIADDCLVWSEPPSFEFDTPQDKRERAFVAKDPIHTEHTFNFVKLRLQDLVQRAGGEAAFQENWAVNVDKEVLAGFQSLSLPRSRKD